MKKTSRRLTFFAALGLLASAVAYMGLAPNRAESPGKNLAESQRIKEQAEQFIGYYHSIALTKDQEKVKNEALTAIPAPCCHGYSIATCCCPCNLAKSVWGLSHFLIAKKGYSPQQVKAEVQQWISATNPGGYAGNACYVRHCNQAFETDGCGGMDERQVL